MHRYECISYDQKTGFGQPTQFKKTRRLSVLNFDEILNFFLIKIHLIEIRSAQEVMSRYEILTSHPSVSL